MPALLPGGDRMGNGRNHPFINSKGFTLIELLVIVAIQDYHLAVFGPENGTAELGSRTASEAADAARGQGQGVRIDDSQRPHALIRDMEKAVRKAYPGISLDESQSLRRSLETVLLDPNTSIESTEPNLILQYWQPTLSRWKFEQPHQFAPFVATTQWVLREYFTHKGRSLPEVLKARQAQWEWQKDVALGLIDRMADGVGKKQKVDPRTEELIKTFVQDLQREMANPLNPFFRPPLSEEQWQRYRTRVEKLIQREIARLKAELEDIDRTYDQEERARSIREKLGHIIHSSDEERRKSSKWLAYQGCVLGIAANFIQDYCMANFPPLDSPRFAPFKIRGVGISCGFTCVAQVYLELWEE
jgi:hypothetical protein